jgi:hypothetical protein
MPDIKPIRKASQDFAADLAVLRDDITKLPAAVIDITVRKRRLRQAWSSRVPIKNLPIALPRCKIGSAAWDRISRPRLSAILWWPSSQHFPRVC